MDIIFGHEKNLRCVGNFDLFFKVTAEKKLSNLSICAAGLLFYLKTKLIYQFLLGQP